MGSGGKKDGPTELRTILSGVVSRLGIDRNLDDYRIWQAWDEVVGPQVARNAEPVKLDRRRLVVSVRSNGWMQELSLLRHDIRDRLNAWMGREVIGEIFLVVGKSGSAPKRPDRRGAGGRAVTKLWDSHPGKSNEEDD